jgi:hypothetical protein
MILKLTRKTAERVSESSTEWQALENCVRLGQWTIGSRADENRLLQVVAELRAPLRVEDSTVLRAGPTVAEVPKSG